MENQGKGPLLTQEGRKQLEAELRHLKTDERERLQKAKLQADTDSPESAQALTQYVNLCESFNESRIATVEDVLAKATIIDPKTLKSETAIFGATVVLVNPTESSLKLKLVSVHESNIRAGKLSIESHLGKLLLGKKMGDRVVVNTPDGEFEFKVESVNFE
jgi:transcription elongation factor GreA